MDKIYFFNLALIGVCVVFCVYKGFNNRIFKSLSFAYICILACCLGSKYGKLLIPDIDFIDIENKLMERHITEKINSAIVSALGTIILIISLNILLKQIFKVVDGRLEKTLYVEIMDRICGAVDGLFVLYEIGSISIESKIEVSEESTADVVPEDFVFHKSTDIYELVRNLN